MPPISRTQSKFNPAASLLHNRSLDKFYDVKRPKKHISGPNFEKQTGRRDHAGADSHGSTLDYSPNHTFSRPRSAAHGFSGRTRGLGTDIPADDQVRIKNDKKKDYKSMQEELEKEEKRQREKQIRKNRTGICMAVGTSRDDPVIGAPVVVKRPLTAGAIYNPNYSSVEPTKTGGYISKLERSVSTDPSRSKRDDRVYDVKYTLQDKRMSNVTMGRSSGRGWAPRPLSAPEKRKQGDSDFSTGGGPRTVGVGGGGQSTVSNNRDLLNNLLKKVDRELAAAEPAWTTAIPTGNVNPLSSFKGPSAPANDFFLGGGRADILFQGKGPPAVTLVRDVVDDVTCQTERVRLQLHLVKKQDEQVRKQIKQHRAKKSMNSTEMQAYRLSEDYKLKKTFNIYHDKDIEKLVEELAARGDPEKTNTAGSMYRVSLLTRKKEQQREQAAKSMAALSAGMASLPVAREPSGVGADDDLQ
eukprot:TRINITY_DN62425_c0_g2_i1.p1 TRINITY_DN62425_c0_g2~~TRINITY_DN62425_c0_g2_i1.p1  ORF type:complete len:469 (-),score=47.14 TRINITY_DN62425_c0_g2_i1:1230-2636(-)